MLKREFGNHLTFCGGVRTQDILSHGIPAEVTDMARALKKELGRNGGYIFSNGITIQEDVPLENIVALINAARNEG